MEISLAKTADDARQWTDFVEQSALASNYHRWGWKLVIEDAFQWPTYYLLARKKGRVAGLLPLVWQKSMLFGSFVTSIPYFNSGGVLAEDAETASALVREAVAITERAGARYLELRHRHEIPLDLVAQTHKVSVFVRLHPDEEKMWKACPSKIRQDVRRAQRMELTTEVGGAEFLSEFYEIFVENMRNLGTPVYGPQFFHAVFKHFPNDSYIVIVRHKGLAIATSFLTGFRDMVEVCWTASRYAFLSMKPNMLLHWAAQRFAAEKGYQIYDFGRSTKGTGTHRFKTQWGSEEVPLFWNYWVREGKELPGLSPDNKKFQLAIRVWQKLPLALTRLIGPPIVRRLP